MKKLLALFSVFQTLMVCAGSFTLVRDGRAEAVIVLPERPTIAVQLAAVELVDAVKQITGTTLPVVRKTEPDKVSIHIGDTELSEKLGMSAASFREQEYAVHFYENAIILNGRDTADFRKLQCDLSGSGIYRNMPSFWSERGPLNAAYYLIEYGMGVRFLNQTPYGTFYPKSKDLKVTCRNVRRAPFMHYRDIAGMAHRPERQDDSMHLFSGKSPEAKAWERLAYGNSKRRNYGMLFLLRRNFGGTLVKANHSLLDYYDYYLKKDAKKHITYRPEFFAKGYSTPAQLCSTNRELQSTIAKQIQNYFMDKDIQGKALKERNWGPHNFAVVPDDNGLQCLCPECRKLLDAGKVDAHGKRSSSELIFRFVNNIAEKVMQTNPEETISCLAYADYEMPPSFSLAGNIAVHYCWYANRSPGWRPEYKACETHFLAWAGRMPKRGLYLWLYNTFPHERAANNNWNCFPGFFARQAGAQYKLFRKHNVRGVFHCGWGQEVENYVALRMMDNPELEPEDLIHEYFKLMFGPAAASMQAFYDAAERFYMGENNVADTYEIHWGKVGTPERMEQLRNYMNLARKQAANSPWRERVALWYDGIWKYMRDGADSFKRRNSVPLPRLVAARIPDAGGNPENADLSVAAPVMNWYLINSSQPALRKLSARMGHDGKYLYLEFIDPCDTRKLRVSPGVFSHDCWELFISNINGGNYRQYAFGPTGLTVLVTHGEVNFRKNVRLELPTGVKSVRMRSDENQWIQRIALPLDAMLPVPLRPGDVFYLSSFRSAGPAVCGRKDWTHAISAMVSHSVLHDPYRMAEIRLEK